MPPHGTRSIERSCPRKQRQRDQNQINPAAYPEANHEGDYTYGYLDWSFNYDVAPDGMRFVMVEEGPATKATFLVNWLAELERLFPGS